MSIVTVSVACSEGSCGHVSENADNALGDIDSNYDGMITAADAKFAELKIWQDQNQVNFWISLIPAALRIYRSWWVVVWCVIYARLPELIKLY